MTNGQPKLYKVDHGPGVKEQILAIAAIAKQAGKLGQFIEILEKAVYLLETDPIAWGDPQYRSKFVDAVYFQAMLSPVMFRYAVYEQARGVLLRSVQLYADFP